MNADISTMVNLLAETGPFSVPIRCYTKKALMRLSAPSVDFGAGVTLGEAGATNFAIINDGALRVEYTIEVGVEHEVRA